MPEPHYVNTQLIIGCHVFWTTLTSGRAGEPTLRRFAERMKYQWFKGDRFMRDVANHDSKSQKADLLMATTTDKSCREWTCPTKTSPNVIWGIGRESAGTQQLCLCGSKPERRFKLTYPFSGEACYPQRYAGAPGLSRWSSQGSVWFPGTCTHTVGRDRKTVSVIKSSKKLWFLLLCSVGCMSKQSC